MANTLAHGQPATTKKTKGGRGGAKRNLKSRSVGGAAASQAAKKCDDMGREGDMDL